MFSLKVKAINLQKSWRIVLLAILVIGIGYFIGRTGKISPETFRSLPAELPKPASTEGELLPEQRLKLEEVPGVQQELSTTGRKEAGKYIEVAQKGEGLTHLARRALKNYLSEHPQNFEIKPEHKIYIEDYLAKSLGGRWLKIGEEVGFSEELIQEALNKAQNLSPLQIQNLSQFVKLVPAL